MGDQTLEKMYIRAIRAIIAGGRPVDVLKGLNTAPPTNHTGIGLLMALLTAYYYGTPAQQLIALNRCLEFLRWQRANGHMAWKNDDEWLSDSHSVMHYVYIFGMLWAARKFGLTELADECRWWIRAHVQVCLLHREPGPGAVRKLFSKLLPHKAPHIATAGFRTHVGGVQADWRELRDQIVALVLGESVRVQKDSESEASTGLWFLYKLQAEFAGELPYLRQGIDGHPLPVPKVEYEITRGKDFVFARFKGNTSGGWRPAEWVFFRWGVKPPVEEYGAVESWGKFTIRTGSEPDIPKPPDVSMVGTGYRLGPPARRAA